MNKTTTATITKEIEDSKKPALIMKSEDICSRNVEDLAITTIEIIITEMITEIIITGDGTIITEVNRMKITNITGTITLYNNHNYNSNNRTVTIRLIICRQI